MPPTAAAYGWDCLPPLEIAPQERSAHVRTCSDFAAGLLDRFPAWSEGLDTAGLPEIAPLAAAVREHGLDAGLRRFRNREMLRIVWRDLCGLATLGETFASLTTLAELCLQKALDEHRRRLEEAHGVPRAGDGSPQQLFVIGLGKLGGGELNLSSDIDIMFCFPHSGACDGRRGLSNDQFFTRQARAVIASLGDISEDGFCFRVDTRLRPFGNAGPLACSVASLEQYYQREGRDWERYALIKARAVAGDRAAGAALIESLRPFVYRRYIDYGAVEALQEMHANVREDALRKDRLDDIKRGPGGIREVEFLAQCFQLLRGGREPALQTPSLHRALQAISDLGLLDAGAVDGIRRDYCFLRLLENRVQALRDQQTHRLPAGEDRARIARSLQPDGVEALEQQLAETRRLVSDRFQAIFPARPEPVGSRHAEHWRQLQSARRDAAAGEAFESPGDGEERPLELFVRRLERIALSQRARQRLDRFMPALLERIDRAAYGHDTLNRVFDLVLAVCRRSAYLVLLEQHPKALGRMLELFDRSAWIADKVIRFPALLDELIDPALGQHIPERTELHEGVARILETAAGTESELESLNYLKLATELRIAVSQLQGALEGERARAALSDLAAALLGGVLEIAAREIAERHGHFPGTGSGPGCGLGIVGYGSLGAGELGYASDLDIVFLFETPPGPSDGPRPLPPERYYARLAQRVLSFLTVMTPSGRLYEVDTRLRPNGRAGSLVSNTEAFRDYQLNEAWTWELQALTRARFIAGAPGVAKRFDEIRREALCRPRDAQTLTAELLDMRQRMDREHGETAAADALASPKHRPGGLIDIEFLAQLGVLTMAVAHPAVVHATGTLAQLRELAAVGWLSETERDTLADILRALRRGRMMAALLPEQQAEPVDAEPAAQLFRERFDTGNSGAA